MAGDSDDVAEHRARGRVTASTATIKHELPRRIGFDEHRVERFAHAGKRVTPRHHRGMDSNRHTSRYAVRPVHALADREEFDNAIHVGCGLDVSGGDFGDALAVDIATGDPGVEGKRGQDGGLGCRIETLDIGGRVGLGIPQRLRLADRVGEPSSGRVHLVEHIVRRAVDDADDLADAVSRKGLAQRAQQRDGARNGRLVVEIDAVLSGRGIQRRAVLGQQRLVGGDDRRAVLHSAQDERAGWLDAADDLDDDVSPGDEFGRIGGE